MYYENMKIWMHMLLKEYWEKPQQKWNTQSQQQAMWHCKLHRLLKHMGPVEMGVHCLCLLVA